MKKMVSILLALVFVLSLCVTASAEEPRVLTMLTARHSDTPVANAEDLWFIKHLQEKYNIKIDVTQATDDALTQQISLMFNTGDLPDLVWTGLNADDCMLYGVQQGLILSWNDYLNEQDMPNAYQAMLDYPDAFAAATAPDGKIYALPYLRGPVYDNNTGAFTGTIRVYVNQKWLDACGLEVPTSLDEMLDMLRTFKDEDPMGVGEVIIPCIDNQNKIKDIIWNALGFYAGNGGQEYGTVFAIKNEEVVLPCYTAEAKAFLEFMNTLFTEKLISEDYFTLDQNTNRGLMAQGVCGMFGDSTLSALSDEEKFNWVAVAPMTSEYNDMRVASTNFGYSTGTFASAKSENIDLIVAITDYLYSKDGATAYTTGPMVGSEMSDFGCDRWYYDEETHTITKDIVKNGTYIDLTNGVCPYYYISGRFDTNASYRYELLGMENEIPTGVLTDKITGVTLECEYTKKLDPSDPNDYWRYIQSEACADYLTFIRLPATYLSVVEQNAVADIKVQVENYVKQESAKFITGARSLDEFDAYMQELKDIGIEDYIEVYKDSYSGYMAGIFE